MSCPPPHRLYLGLLLVVSLGALSACTVIEQAAQLADAERPTAHIRGAQVTDLSLDRLDLRFDVEVTNPNPFAVRLATYRYRLAVDGKALARGDQGTGAEIPAEGSQVIAVPVSLPYQQLFEGLPRLADAEQSTYRLSGRVGVDVPRLGIVNLPMDHTGEIPILRAPTLVFQRLEVERIGFGGADLVLVLETAAAPTLRIADLEARVTVAGRDWATARLDAGRELSGAERVALRVPFSVSLSQVGGTLMDSLRGPGAVDYRIAGQYQLAAASGAPEAMQAFEPEARTFELTGSTNLERSAQP